MSGIDDWLTPARRQAGEWMRLPRTGPQWGEDVAYGAEYVDRIWLEWLAEIGYGVDFTCTPPPPCEPAELAEVYAETDGESVESWTAILLDGNTAGGWYGNGKDEA